MHAGKQRKRLFRRFASEVASVWKVSQQVSTSAPPLNNYNRRPYWTILILVDQTRVSEDASTTMLLCYYVMVQSMLYPDFSSSWPRRLEVTSPTQLRTSNTAGAHLTRILSLVELSSEKNITQNMEKKQSKRLQTPQTSQTLH